MDGRTMRMVIPGPDIPDLESCLPFNLVGFFGLRPQLRRRCQNDLLISSLCHDVDDALSAGIDPGTVSLYMSMEREAGGASFNLVVFREGKGVEDWAPRAGPSHHVAKAEVSPYFYSEVRIHRAR